MKDPTDTGPLTVLMLDRPALLWQMTPAARWTSIFGNVGAAAAVIGRRV